MKIIKIKPILVTAGLFYFLSRIIPTLFHFGFVVPLFGICVGGFAWCIIALLFPFLCDSFYFLMFVLSTSIAYAIISLIE
jgi:hypothetical protein